MVERIDALCREHNTSITALEKTLGFANGSIRKSKETTSAKRLKSIADYFGVSMEYIFDGSQGDLSKHDILLLQAYHKSSSNIQSAINEILHINMETI